MSPSLEKTRSKLSTGSFPSDKIEKLALSYPFGQQVGVVFPQDDALETVLAGMETSYAKGRVRLSDVVANADSARTSNLLLLTSNGSSPDVWCLDTRSVLTLCVDKETHEGLGIAGKSLPFKVHSDQHVIQIPLASNSSASTQRGQVGEHTKQAIATLGKLRAWEQRRVAHEGVPEGSWDVVYCSKDPNQAPVFPPAKDVQVHRVTPSSKNVPNIHVPVISFAPRPSSTSTTKSTPKLQQQELSEAQDDWDQNVMAIFEWTGLAALGSPRIGVNDRVDPYIAVYEPPQPSSIGDVTRLRWTGLLAPVFVQSVVDQVLSYLRSESNTSANKFAVITVHNVSTTPVSYLSPASKQASLRLPRSDAEDTWALLVGVNASGQVSWTLFESIGQWDTRWG